MTQFLIEPRAPFRLDLTAWALRRRAHNAIDRWNGSSYERVLSVDGDGPYALSVTQDEGPAGGPPRRQARRRIRGAARTRCSGADARAARRPRAVRRDGRARSVARPARSPHARPQAAALSDRLRGPRQRHRVPAAIACRGDPPAQSPDRGSRLPASARTPTAPAHSQVPTSSRAFSPNRSGLTASARPRPARSSTRPVRSSRATSISRPWSDSTIARQWSASRACAASVAGPPST